MLKKYLFNLFFFFTTVLSYAHEVRPGLLQIEQIDENTYHILWKIPSTGKAVPKIYLGLPEHWIVKNRSANFISNSFRQEFDYEIKGPLYGARITFDGLQNTIMDVLVTINTLDGIKFTGLIKPDNPQYVIPQVPSVWRISKTYLILGFEHILLGIDHLLFVLALVLITFGKWRIIKTITAFTLAHSITLSMAVLGFVNVPSAPVEAIIALSIVFLAVELVKFTKGKNGLTVKYPWLIAFIFGLLHGFGFAGALTDVGLPQIDIPFALAFFNIGVELGQLSFVLVILAIIFLLKKIKIKQSAWVKLAPAYCIGTIAAMWCFERILGFWF